MFYFVQEFLVWISKATEISFEQVQFVFCMVLNIPLGVFYRLFLSPKRVSPSFRLLVSMIWGLMIGWLCFGSEILWLILVSTLCYVLTWRVNPKNVHRVVFIVSFFCLSAAQIARMFLHYGINRFDYSGRLMVITVKVTYVASSLNDGLGRKEDELTPEQKAQRIRRFPSLLEYFSYIFHHSSFLVGPVCSFKDYMDFIMGEDMARAKKENGKEPSPKKAVLEKLMSCLLCAVLFSVGAKIFPADLNADPHFIANSTLFWRMAVSFFVMFIQRLKYYFAWIIADVGNNACGLGFNGYDSNGKELWNRVTNVNVVELETSTNFRAMVQNWNMQTNLWLKRTVYDRVPHLAPYQRTMLTYTISTIWHGFYPGYYLTFLNAILIIVATRTVRRTYGHMFQSTNSTMNLLFVFLKWFANNVIFASYCFTPFLLLRLDLSLAFYRSTYFIGHILLLLPIIFVHGTPKPSHDAFMTSQDSNGISNSKAMNGKDIPTSHVANNNAILRRNRSA